MFIEKLEKYYNDSIKFREKKQPSINTADEFRNIHTSSVKNSEKSHL